MTDQHYKKKKLRKGGGGVDEVEAGQEDQDSTGLFQDQGAFRFFVPVEITLDYFCKCSSKNNYRTMAQAVEQQEQDAVPWLGGSQSESDAQHGGHKGEGAGTQGNAEHQAQNKGGQGAFAFHADLGRAEG